MKKMNFFFITITGLILLASCKKDDGNPSPAGPSRSMSILNESATTPGGNFIKNRFILLDIDHASNSDKQFMTVDIVENAGSYKFQVVEGPKPITDYSTNWPAEVKKVLSVGGLGHDFTVSAFMKMRAAGVTRPYTFTYDSIHKFNPLSSVIIPINEMHNTIYAGTMAGKEPQGKIDLWVPGKPDPGTTPIDVNDTVPDYFFYAHFQRVSRPGRLYFYFDEGMYTSVGSPINRSVRLQESIFRPIDALSGKADAVLSYEGNTSVIFFFDFDRWEYMTVTFPCHPVYGATCSNNVDFSPIKSMNDLMNWPAGWAQ